MDIRYIQYFSRYSSNDKSIKFADMQREHVVSRMNRMNKSMSLLKTTTSTYVDVEFLIQSVEQVQYTVTFVKIILLIC
jgi:hypothetical protein